jgi:hypothetical protein
VPDPMTEKFDQEIQRDIVDLKLRYYDWIERRGPWGRIGFMQSIELGIGIALGFQIAHWIGVWLLEFWQTLIH